jgi:hypothetical protein
VIGYKDKMAELTGKLLNVLKKRGTAARERETVEIKEYAPSHGLKKNFYQISYRNLWTSPINLRRCCTMRNVPILSGCN